MEFRVTVICFFVLCSWWIKVCSAGNRPCEIIPLGVTKNKKINDNRYVIEITGKPESYVPLQLYTVTLKLNPTKKSRKPFREFILSVESLPFDDEETVPNVGNLKISEDLKARFSATCPNTVIQSSTLAKTDVKLLWQAPPPNSGCVAFKAAVVESRDTWFGEDDSLTVNLCEEHVVDLDKPPVILRHCCACDEATYEMAFEGTWVRNTHPKEFPSDLFSTKFSDVIGASHSFNNAFWEYAGIASDALKLLAEEGDTTELENELKEKNEEVRTIIKARGLAYPDLKGTTYAIFRVDNRSHLVSLVSKIIPSPDWVVGVSNFELCTRDCSWLESRTINLYPWDIGTDDGITYLEKSPRYEPHQIRRLKSNSPSDERSPFFDPSGSEINPLARLHLTRLRTYKKSCDNSARLSSEDNGEEDHQEHEEAQEKCAASDWSDWSPCTEVCQEGEMFRSRSYINPDDQFICHEPLVEKKDCFVHTKMCPGENPEEVLDDADCELTDWSEWSSCSVTCGKGTRTKDRKFKNAEYENMCSQNDEVELQENEDCYGEETECEGEEEQQAELCPGTKWGYWSNCNATCESGGRGVKERYVIVINEDIQSSCVNDKYKEVVECTEPCDEDNEGEHRPFDGLEAQNQITHNEQIGPAVDCKVTKWSVWSPCIMPGYRKCGNGYKEKVRRIKVHPMNGGKKCPNQLRLRRRCSIPCEEEEASEGLTEEINPEEDERIDCVMGPWSSWSPCSTDCGHTAVQQRTRNYKVKPNKYGRPCGHRIELKDCPLPVACTDDGEPTL